MATLKAAPFNLVTGDSVVVKVVNYNAVGNSPDSFLGSGALVFTSVVPDAPINLAKIEDSTSLLQITFSWQAGVSNGG